MTSGSSPYVYILEARARQDQAGIRLGARTRRDQTGIYGTIIITSGHGISFLPYQSYMYM